MKTIIAAMIFFAVVFTTGALERKAVGSFHAMEGYDFKELTVRVYADPKTIQLDTSVFTYTLRQPEWDSLLRLMRKAVHYTEIARDNSTTFDYQKDVGNFMTEENVGILITFTTRGWADCVVALKVSTGGRNTILSMSSGDAADMVHVLSAAVGATVDFQRQLMN